MYTTYIMRRTQIYIGDDQEHALAQRARAEGRTKSDLIRQAIDSYLKPADTPAVDLQRLRAAVREAAGVAPYLPSGKDYVEQERASDRGRQARLDQAREDR